MFFFNATSIFNTHVKFWKLVPIVCQWNYFNDTPRFDSFESYSQIVHRATRIQVNSIFILSCIGIHNYKINDVKLHKDSNGI